LADTGKRSRDGAAISSSVVALMMTARKSAVALVEAALTIEASGGKS
jgi:hypothetical protein